MIFFHGTSFYDSFLRLQTATTYGPCSLVFRDLNIGQLELVLDFIYRGELAVDRTQFELLARACDYLQIKASLITEGKNMGSGKTHSMYQKKSTFQV